MSRDRDINNKAPGHYVQRTLLQEDNQSDIEYSRHLPKHPLRKSQPKKYHPKLCWTRISLVRSLTLRTPRTSQSTDIQVQPTTSDPQLTRTARTNPRFCSRNSTVNPNPNTPSFSQIRQPQSRRTATPPPSSMPTYPTSCLEKCW